MCRQGTITGYVVFLTCIVCHHAVMLVHWGCRRRGKIDGCRRGRGYSVHNHHSSGPEVNAVNYNDQRQLNLIRGTSSSPIAVVQECDVEASGVTK